MTHRFRWEYSQAICARYHQADRRFKHMILNGFCLNTRYNRKHAIRRLNGPPPVRVRLRTRHPRPPCNSPVVVSVLAAVWEAAGHPWSVRLKAPLPLWRPWVRKRFRVGPEVERQVGRIDPSQIDCRLQARKTSWKRRIYGRTKPGVLLKHQIPIKTEHLDVKVLGFADVDLVSHSDKSAGGEIAYSLNITDIHTMWTETGAVLGRGQAAVLEASDEIEAALPFRLLSINSDNGSEFID